MSNPLDTELLIKCWTQEVWQLSVVLAFYFQRSNTVEWTEKTKLNRAKCEKKNPTKSQLGHKCWRAIPICVWIDGMRMYGGSVTLIFELAINFISSRRHLSSIEQYSMNLNVLAIIKALIPQDKLNCRPVNFRFLMFSAATHAIPSTHSLAHD